jgi:hypothetical protein
MVGKNCYDIYNQHLFPHADLISPLAILPKLESLTLRVLTAVYPPERLVLKVLHVGLRKVVPGLGFDERVRDDVIGRLCLQSI